MTLHIESWTAGPLANNIYLLWDEVAGQAVIVDPSIAGEPALERMRELAVQGVVLHQIWNTHGHFDHVYDNARWKQEYSVPLLMHRDDEFLLDRLREQSLWVGLEAPPRVQPDAALHEGQELSLGHHRARVLHTPGHSPGSVSFWFEAASCCISGDVLFRGGVGRTDLPGCSVEALGQSLRRLAGLPPDTRILPGHGPQTTVGLELATNSYLQQLHTRTMIP